MLSAGPPRSVLYRNSTAALLAGLFGGAYGFQTFFLSRSQGAVGSYMAMVIALAWLVAFVTLLQHPIAFRPLVVRLTVFFGTLPFLDFAYALVSGKSTIGFYSYMFQYAGFFTAPYWVWLTSRYGFRPAEVAIKWYALVVSIRQIAVFVLPEQLGQSPLGPAYDGTLVYAYVGGLPRVFGPGAIILVIAVMLYVSDWLKGRLLFRGFVAAVLCILATLMTLTRGTILIEFVMIGLVLTFGKGRSGILKKFIGSLSGVVCLAGVGALLWFAANNAFSSDLGDRTSLDDATFRWRYAQVERAFYQGDRTWKDVVLGVGPNTFIRNDVNSRDETNELHYSWASILWTFGVIGFSTLLVVCVRVTIDGWKLGRELPETFPWTLGLLVLFGMGIYAPVFTTLDGVLAVSVCTGTVTGAVVYNQKLKRTQKAAN